MYPKTVAVMKAVHFLLLLASALTDAQNNKPPRECGPFEVYHKPGVDALCDPTCDDIHEKCPPPNTHHCLCIEGYVRDANERCIRKDECPPKCRHSNEVYYPDCNAPLCEQTCASWSLACDGEPHGGCFCGTGYARDDSGKCVLLPLCLYTCTGRSEIYISPSTRIGKCVLRCSKDGEILCDHEYPTSNGCTCMQGLVRNVDGECIPGELCKPPCPK